MSSLLRGLLVTMVLLNLAFVHLTGAAEVAWLAPLVGLTIASPLLLPWRHHIVYRLAWNAAVLAVFALLVQHASSAGVQYMLEDGLLLAALCQVHLLNNIGRDQKPDLIFFNSFLIAVVTCFLSFDLGYSLVFLAYAPVLLFALQVYTLERSGRALTPRLLRRMIADGAVRSALVLGLTLAVFLFLPRDFTRRGLLGDRIRWQPGEYLTASYTEDVSLDRTGTNLGDGDRIVMVVRLDSGNPAAVPPEWRGGTLDLFDGRQWLKAAGIARGRGEPWERTGGPTLTRGAGPEGTTVEVELRDPTLARLFVPIEARRVTIATNGVFERIQAEADQTLVNTASTVRRGPVRYEVEMNAKRAALGGAVGASSNRVSELLRSIDSRAVPAAARALARKIRADAGPDAPQHVVVERMRARLSMDYRWLPPGAEGGAKSLEDFFGGARGAHCEVFASALAAMLRSQKIPCRLVTGFRSGEWDESSGTLTFRDRHAHAWIEVHDPDGGWYTVDPSPLAAENVSEGAGLFARIESALRRVWERITNFTEDGRMKALAWLAALPGRLLDAGRSEPWALVAVALLLGGLLLVRRGRGVREAPPVREYRRCVRRARLVVRPGETPRELLGRADRLALRPERLRRLRAATAAHERSRYAAAQRQS